MPFGLKNAPSTFQSLMNDIFRQYLRKFILVFFDNILVYSGDRDSHLQHLQLTLQLLQQYFLVINTKKCVFAKPQLEYLGQIISKDRLHADPSKIESMVSWPTPTSSACVGSLGWQGTLAILFDVTALLQLHSLPSSRKMLCLDDKAQNAFDKLKIAMTTTPVLALPDFSQPFIVETDASGISLGGVLMQSGRPIAY